MANLISLRRYDHFSQVSSVDYFYQLLELLQVDWLRVPLVQGLITSASAGTEGLIRASLSAMVEFIEKKGDQRKVWTIRLIEDLATILEKNLADDRYAIPAMEIAGFLLDNCLPLAATDPETRFVYVVTNFETVS